MNSTRKPQGNWSGDHFYPPRAYTVDLRGGHNSNRHALERYEKLERLLQDCITMFRHELLYEYANTLVLYRKTSRWRIRQAQSWTLEFEPDEWQALSRGLRSLSHPSGRTMYQWLTAHKVQA